jgi:hypothetical protein
MMVVGALFNCFDTLGKSNFYIPDGEGSDLFSNTTLGRLHNQVIASVSDGITEYQNMASCGR